MFANWKRSDTICASQCQFEYFCKECKTIAKISISEKKVGWNGNDVVDDNTYDELKMITTDDKGQMHFGMIMMDDKGQMNLEKMIMKECKINFENNDDGQ